MRKIVFLLILINSFNLFAQYEDKWKEVYQFELEGKIKSAQERVEEIYKKAKRKKDEIQIIKCFFYQSKFEQVFDEKAQTIIINNVQKEINEAKPVSKALLSFIYITILEDYYKNNYGIIKNRTNIETKKSKDFLTWTVIDFSKEINQYYEHLLVNEKELRETNIKIYNAIFDISPSVDIKNYSIYDFLAQKKGNYLKSKITSWKQKKSSDFEKELETFYDKPEVFVKYDTKKLQDKNFRKLISFLQNNEKYYLEQNNYEKLDFAYFERLKYVRESIWNEEYYLDKVEDIEKSTTNIFLKQFLRIERLKYYQTKTFKNGEINLYNNALALVDTILNTKVNINALAEAENIKLEILKKSLSVSIPKTSYSEQNTRAFINFKNVDSITISYFEFPQKWNYVFKNYYYSTSEKWMNKDSIIQTFVKNNKPLKSQKIKLPNKHDYFEYSTEILLEKLNLGNYLVYVETKNDSVSKEKVYAYDKITVTNMYVIEDDENNKDTFYIYDRKTGKPLENVLISSEDEKTKTNTNGSAFLKHKKRKKDYKYNSEVSIISNADSLNINYDRDFLIDPSEEFEDDYENWEAKAMVYFDRSIYRPGQKMYYKGIIIQKKDKVKSVVPFVTVQVSIRDVNNTILKEFDVQTNEYGSFSGEFDIPKNTLTGSFSIEIDEPDDYKQDSKYYDKKEEEHKFWDNVDFESYTDFDFKVEEYKRPTFEVTFDEIKENYTIGDSIKITGNAKALAGNNLTNAKVTYSITKSGYSKTRSIPHQENYIISDTKTDENGNFKILFSATEPSISNEEINSLTYTIKVDVTDIQGETREASKTVRVSQEMLQLNLSVQRELFVEDLNKIQITTTTLNNFPIEAKGSLKIYELKNKKFLKNRENPIPEIQVIPRDEFQKLFPHEPYENSDTEQQEVLIKTIPFDTKIAKEITLDFLKSYRNTEFKIIAEAYDIKNNLISDETVFNVKSKQHPYSEKELFTYKDISEPESKQYTIEIHSIIPNLYITSRFYVDENPVNEVKTIQLVNGKGIFKFDKNSTFKNNLTFHFSSVWENDGYEKFYQINSESIENTLQFEIESIRNKIEPGSIENWSFKVINQKLETEILASMYDSSLDQFSNDFWNSLSFREYNSYHRTPVMKNYNESVNLNFYNFKIQKNYFAIYERDPELYWFGFYFSDPKNYTVQKNYQKKIYYYFGIPKNAKLISGIVQDELGPIAGANVHIKGTNRGTTTDFDGEFSIEAAKGEIIVVSYTGKKSEEITIEQAKNLEISLNDDVVSGSEVVVTGYGKTTKEAHVGTATSYNRENSFDDDGYLSQALRGKIAGVSVKNDTLSNGRIMIRGFGSVNGNKNPLYIIDGVPVSGDALNIDPNNIESLNILKDAAATSIYGSKGANGVILITTKNAIKELAQVKTRSNFNETAFFYPHIKTDRNGEFSFQFTTPESLTKWKLRLLGHNKNSESGYFESSIISQKDVMIQTNMPRFVREKDEITLTAKVVNLTHEVKSGNAMLLLFDATNMQPIDAIAKNNSNVKAFNCNSKESVPVSWTITIPEGVQGLQYKIVAKSGNFSDGEENILPVMSNKVLLTESIPIWVKGNSKKEYVFDNLTNNDSKTLKNHLFTLEYTSNPTWLALQSLPYLMEYEHECAEQIFSRYYGNFIATEIISSNPKIASLFESWKNNPKAVSKLTQNEELKSIVLNETPWLLDVESEELKNKRLALLMDLNTMKESQDKTIKKMEEKQLASGGFAWFDGGEENIFISQHIVSGFGHLSKLFPEKKSEFKNITSKAIPYLDSKYISQSTLKNDRINYFIYSNLHYLYARSFYLEEFPISKKIDSIINIQKVEFKANWLNYSLYQKGLLALTMNRFGDKKFAEKIISNLKETVARNDDFGMYWIENKNGYYWYQSAIETQALLIEAFSEIEKDKKFVDEMKVWLLKQKQLKHWPTTKATTEAIYALLLQGTDWTSIKDNTKFKIGNEKVLSKKLSEKDKDANTGYIKMNWKPDEISKEIGQISVENKSDVAGFGGLYLQYFEDLEAIKSDSTSALSITKKLYKKIKTSEGEKLVDINSENVKIGDLITIRIIIKTENDLEFVHLKDLRAACFEPVDVISKYEWKNGISYYRSTKDVATHFFFDKIKTGTYVFEYDVRVNNSGIFNDGIATIQSMYAPEFSSHSTNTKLSIQK